MNGLRYKLAAFMQGRNGADQLSVFALIVYAVVAFIRIFLRRHPIAYYIAGALMTLAVVYIVFRVLSTNISIEVKSEIDLFRINAATASLKCSQIRQDLLRFCLAFAIISLETNSAT